MDQGNFVDPVRFDASSHTPVVQNSSFFRFPKIRFQGFCFVEKAT
jgi:hypothetical protein